jgi:hypothetical protein
VQNVRFLARSTRTWPVGHDDVLVSLGKYEEALVEYRQTLQLFLAIGHCSVADCKVNIGLVCKAMGNKSEAKQMFT